MDGTTLSRPDMMDDSLCTITLLEAEIEAAMYRMLEMDANAGMRLHLIWRRVFNHDSTTNLPENPL